VAGEDSEEWGPDTSEGSGSHSEEEGSAGGDVLVQQRLELEGSSPAGEGSSSPAGEGSSSPAGEGSSSPAGEGSSEEEESEPGLTRPPSLGLVGPESIAVEGLPASFGEGRSGQRDASNVPSGRGVDGTGGAEALMKAAEAERLQLEAELAALIEARAEQLADVPQHQRTAHRLPTHAALSFMLGVQRQTASEEMEDAEERPVDRRAAAKTSAIEDQQDLLEEHAVASALQGLSVVLEADRKPSAEMDSKPSVDETDAVDATLEALEREICMESITRNSPPPLPTPEAINLMRERYLMLGGEPGGRLQEQPEQPEEEMDATMEALEREISSGRPVARAQPPP